MRTDMYRTLHEFGEAQCASNWNLKRNSHGVNAVAVLCQLIFVTILGIRARSRLTTAVMISSGTMYMPLYTTL